MSSSRLDLASDAQSSLGDLFNASSTLPPAQSLYETQVLMQTKSGKFEEHSLILTSIGFTLSKNKKVVSECNYRSLMAVTSTKPNELILSVVQTPDRVNSLLLSASDKRSASQLSNNFDAQYVIQASGPVDDILAHIVASLRLSYPGLKADSVIFFVVEPTDRIDVALKRLYPHLEWQVPSISTEDPALPATIWTANGPCDGLPTAYLSACQWFNMVPRGDVLFAMRGQWHLTNEGILHSDYFDSLDSWFGPTLEAASWGRWCRTVSFYFHKLSSEMTRQLAIFIQRSPSVTSLSVVHTNLSKESLLTLTEAIGHGHFKNIVELDLSGNPQFDEKSLMSLANGIMKSCPKLRSLKLTSCDAKKGIVFLMASLHGSVSSTLTHLDLSDNPLGTEALQAIADYASKPNALVDLNLANTGVHTNLEQLLAGLQAGSDMTLRYLNVSNSAVTAASSAQRPNPTLLQQVTQFGIRVAALKVLNLNGTKPTSDFLSALLSGLANNSILTGVSLSLQNCDLSSSEAEVLMQQLPLMHCLGSLDLSNNDMTDVAVGSILQGLGNNTSVHTLNLNNSLKRVKDLASLIRASKPPIKALYMRNFGAKLDLIEVLDAIALNSTLIELDCSENSLGDRGAFALSRVFHVNVNLRRLFMDGNGITLTGLTALTAALERNGNLSVVDISRDVEEIVRLGKNSIPIQRTLSTWTDSLKRNNITKDSIPRLSMEVLVEDYESQLSLSTSFSNIWKQIESVKSGNDSTLKDQFLSYTRLAHQLQIGVFDLIQNISLQPSTPTELVLTERNLQEIVGLAYQWLSASGVPALENLDQKSYESKSVPTFIKYVSIWLSRCVRSFLITKLNELEKIINGILPMAITQSVEVPVLPRSKPKPATESVKAQVASDEVNLETSSSYSVKGVMVMPMLPAEMKGKSGIESLRNRSVSRSKVPVELETIVAPVESNIAAEPVDLENSEVEKPEQEHEEMPKEEQIQELHKEEPKLSENEEQAPQKPVTKLQSPKPEVPVDLSGVDAEQAMMGRMMSFFKRKDRSAKSSAATSRVTSPISPKLADVTALQPATTPLSHPAKERVSVNRPGRRLPTAKKQAETSVESSEQDCTSIFNTIPINLDPEQVTALQLLEAKQSVKPNVAQAIMNRPIKLPPKVPATSSMADQEVQPLKIVTGVASPQESTPSSPVKSIHSKPPLPPKPASPVRSLTRESSMDRDSETEKKDRRSASFHENNLEKRYSAISALSEKSAPAMEVSKPSVESDADIGISSSGPEVELSETLTTNSDAATSIDLTVTASVQKPPPVLAKKPVLPGSPKSTSVSPVAESKPVAPPTVPRRPIDILKRSAHSSSSADLPLRTTSPIRNFSDSEEVENQGARPTGVTDESTKDFSKRRNVTSVMLDPSVSVPLIRRAPANDMEITIQQGFQWLKNYLTDFDETKAEPLDSLSDAILLICALENASGSPAPGKYHKKAMLPVHRIDNLNVALSFLAKLGIHADVSAEAIHAKDKKILAVLYHAILGKYPLQVHE